MPLSSIDDIGEEMRNLFGVRLHMRCRERRQAGERRVIVVHLDTRVIAAWLNPQAPFRAEQQLRL